MFSYMIEKKIDEYYRKAYREGFIHSLKNFRSKSPVEMARNSGAVYNPDSSIITLQSLKQSIDVHFPDGRIVFTNSNLSLKWDWCLIILNYLHRADNTTVSNRLISYRELEDGRLFYPAFSSYCIKPLATKLSHEPPERVERAFLKLTDNIEINNDIYTHAVFSFLPRFPVTVKIWFPDEELGGSANILFDANANHYLHTEDIAVVGYLISHFLIKECEKNLKIPEGYAGNRNR